MRYVIETECEVCGLHEAEEHQRRGGHFNALGEWCDGSGGSRRVVEPATPDYEAAQQLFDSILLNFGVDNLIIDTDHIVDAALAGLVVIEGEPK